MRLNELCKGFYTSHIKLLTLGESQPEQKFANALKDYKQSRAAQVVPAGKKHRCYIRSSCGTHGTRTSVFKNMETPVFKQKTSQRLAFVLLHISLR